MRQEMKVMLISPGNLLMQDSEGGRGVVYSPNFGIAYISKYLEKIFAGKVEILITEIVPENISDLDIKAKIAEIKPDLIGISSKTFNILSAYRVCKLAKTINEKILTVLGGAHGSALPEFSLEECRFIDVVVIGEGELAFSEIVEVFLEEKGDFKHINGIAYRNEKGKIILNERGVLLNDLDEVPFPTYEEI